MYITVSGDWKSSGHFCPRGGGEWKSWREKGCRLAGCLEVSRQLVFLIHRTSRSYVSPGTPLPSLLSLSTDWVTVAVHFRGSRWQVCRAGVFPTSLQQRRQVLTRWPAAGRVTPPTCGREVRGRYAQCGTLARAAQVRPGQA